MMCSANSAAGSNLHAVRLTGHMALKLSRVQHWDPRATSPPVYEYLSHELSMKGVQPSELLLGA